MKRVLLVSDDEWIIDRTATMLEKLGCEVYMATTEDLAVSSCAALKPDAAIIDIEMEGGSGFESISSIRRQKGNTILIAVTRGDHKAIWPKVAEICGAKRYVPGPISMGQLMSLISSDDYLH